MVIKVGITIHKVIMVDIKGGDEPIFASSYLILNSTTRGVAELLRKSLASLVIVALAAVLLQTASALSTVTY